MRNISIIIAVFLVIPNCISACSMYKITKEGKTIVGNNEDWFSANSQVWFVPKGYNKYGVMNVGFDNDFPQGAINEAGLMFDGFAMSYLEVKNTEGKSLVPLFQLSSIIMHSCSTVKQVKAYLSGVNLHYLSNAMLVFVDSSGEYLIVEGDELILGNDSEKSFSNFYPSQTSDIESVDIGFFQNGLKHLKSFAAESESSLDYCTVVMNSFQQDLTQYTTIYDLQELKIRIHHYQNFDEFIELDLVEELNKGAHKLKVPELFSEDTQGYQYYQMYNNADIAVEHFETLWKSDKIKGDASANKILEKTITQTLFHMSNDYVNIKKDKDGAVKLNELIIKLFPKNKDSKKTAKKNIKKISG